MRFKCRGVTFATETEALEVASYQTRHTLTLDLDFSPVAIINPKHGSAHGFTFARLHPALTLNR